MSRNYTENEVGTFIEDFNNKINLILEILKAIEHRLSAR